MLNEREGGLQFEEGKLEERLKGLVFGGFFLWVFKYKKGSVSQKGRETLIHTPFQ